MDDLQTPDEERPSTLAFRVSEETRHLVRWAASRQKVTPSDWLRDVVETALEVERMGGDPSAAGTR